MKKKHGRNFSVHFYMKEANLKKASYYRITLTWHPERGKTMEKVKRSVVARDEVCIGMSIQSAAKDFLGQWKYSVT